MIKILLDKKKQKGIFVGNLFNEVRMHFSVKNDAARFAQRFGNRFLPTRLYAITPAGRFDTCLYFEIQKFLKNYHGIEKIDVEHDFIKTILPGRFNKSYSSINELSKLNLPLRDYQQETVRKCINCGRGVVVLATGGGKNTF